MATKRFTGQWLSSDCAVTMQWLYNDYAVIVQWMCSDCAVFVQWLNVRGEDEAGGSSVVGGACVPELERMLEEAATDLERTIG